MNPSMGPPLMPKKEEKLTERIKELESCLRTVLNASELWLPAQGELLSDEFAGEAQALCEMYSCIIKLIGLSNG